MPAHMQRRPQSRRIGTGSTGDDQHHGTAQLPATRSDLTVWNRPRTNPEAHRRQTLAPPTGDQEVVGSLQAVTRTHPVNWCHAQAHQSPVPMRSPTRAAQACRPDPKIRRTADLGTSGLRAAPPPRASQHGAAHRAQPRRCTPAHTREGAPPSATESNASPNLKQRRCLERDHHSTATAKPTHTHATTTAMRRSAALPDGAVH